MDQAVMQVYSVEECRRPEVGRKARSIQECPRFDSKFIVHDLSGTILGRAVSTGGLDNVVECFDEIDESGALGKFAALISANKAGCDAEFCHEGLEYFNGRFFSLREEDPYALGGSIND